MSVIDRLRRQHQQLEAEIAALLRHGAPDKSRIARLKKRKLAIKDQIAMLMSGPRPVPVSI